MANDRQPSDDGSDTNLPYPTRRRLLQATVAGGVVATVGCTSTAQESERIELGGDTEAWIGRAPADIEEQENPTLELEEGQTYVIEWENVDGQPHNVVIEDADGNELVRSEVISERGETQEVEFEADPAMDVYYCEVHPQSMRGDVVVGGAQEDGDGAGQAGEEARFFEEGAEVGVRHVAEGMTAPTDFAEADDGRMFVTDQTGELWVICDGERHEEPAIDVEDRMVEVGESFEGAYADPDQDYDERGLLGVELHPDFAENDRLFLHYSAPPNDQTPQGWSHVEVISEWQLEDPQTVDPDSEERLMELQQPQYNHDSGPMAFGPDGYLYVPMGDGGGANDEMEGHVDDWYDENAGGNGQDTERNLLGGIHRIDVDGEDGASQDQETGQESEDEVTAEQDGETEQGTGNVTTTQETEEETMEQGTENETTAQGDDETTEQETQDGEVAGAEAWDDEETASPVPADADERPYSIPEDNPLVDAEGHWDEYYSWGWRNPFGITFDSEGRLIAADAGQNLFEEANLVEEGGNYGWNVKEGTHCFSTDDPGQPPEDCPDQAPDDLPDPRGGEELRDPVVEYPHSYQGSPVGIVIAGGHVYEADEIDDLQGKYLFGDWTRDVARQEPDGRVFAATVEDDAGDGVQADDVETEDGGGNETAADGGMASDTGTQNETDVGTENETDVGTVNETDAGTGNETDAGTGNETATADGQAGEDEEVVPRDELWEMEELRFAGSEDGNLHRFVRQFGQGPDGQVYLLVSERGVPQDETGAVLELVPPEEGEQLEEPEPPEEAEGPEAAEEKDPGTVDEEDGAGAGNETQAGTGNETQAGTGNETDVGEQNETDAGTENETNTGTEQ